MPKSNLLLYLETHSIDRVLPTTATSFRRVLALPIGQDPVFEETSGSGAVTQPCLAHNPA